MPNDNEKLARFQKAVFSETESKAAEILSEVDSYKQEKLGDVQEAELQRAYDLIQRQAADIRSGFSREITREKLNARQRVLLRRKELTEQLFEKAADKLLNFTETDAYQAYLSGLLKAQGNLDGVKILARAKDLEILRGMGVSAEASAQIRLGGLIFVDEAGHRYDDQTLDSRLKDAEERFYTSGKGDFSQMEGVGTLA